MTSILTPNPSGLCLCGCGQKTTLARNTDARAGTVRGQPRCYILGHHQSRPKTRAVVPPNPSGICLCGCGEITPLAPRGWAARRWVKGEHTRYITGHRKNRTLAQRYWRYVVKHDGCWEWTGGKTSKGYGFLKERKRHMGAHRISWEIHHGPIPEGMNVLHTCDNPPCTNPDHLFLGTIADNSQDMVRKGRHIMQQHPERAKRHEEHPNSLLTVEQVREIRRDYRPYVVTRDMLAARYNVAPNTIKDVVEGRGWRDV